MFISTEHGYLFAEMVNQFKSTPLFLLPGGPGYGHLTYKLSQPEFEKHFTTIYYDPRGCGQSLEFPPAAMSMANNIEDIERIRSYFGFNDIMLLGTSYGSMVALGYAIKYPQYVSKLLLVGGAPSYHFIETTKEYLMTHGSPEQIAICNNFLWPGRFMDQTHVDRYFYMLHPLHSNRVAANPELAQLFNPMIKCMMTPLNQAFRNNFWKFDFTNELKNIRSKTNIFVGRDDWVTPPAYAEIMHNNIQNSILTYFDTGHSIAFDCPDEYFKQCKDFLDN